MYWTSNWWTQPIGYKGPIENIAILSRLARRKGPACEATLMVLSRLCFTLKVVELAGLRVLPTSSVLCINSYIRFASCVDRLAKLSLIKLASRRLPSLLGLTLVPI